MGAVGIIHTSDYTPSHTARNGGFALVSLTPVI